MLYGYARVSTAGQQSDGQVADLQAAGCQRIYSETASGAAGRPQLRRLIAALREGDVLIVSRIDRLARSTRDLLDTLAAVAGAGATFKSLGDPWADTTSPHGRLVVTVLAGLAEFERHLILARTGEGRQRAVARGVRMGRPAVLTGRQRRFVAEERAAGTPLGDLARILGVSRSTIKRIPAAASAQLDLERQLRGEAE